MKKFFVYFLLAGFLTMVANTSDAQAKKRTVQKRTTAKKPLTVKQTLV